MLLCIVLKNWKIIYSRWIWQSKTLRNQKIKKEMLLCYIIIMKLTWISKKIYDLHITCEKSIKIFTFTFISKIFLHWQLLCTGFNSCPDFHTGKKNASRKRSFLRVRKYFKKWKKNNSNRWSEKCLLSLLLFSFVEFFF